jgi:hypothetical protein
MWHERRKEQRNNLTPKAAIFTEVYRGFPHIQTNSGKKKTLKTGHDRFHPHVSNAHFTNHHIIRGYKFWIFDSAVKYTIIK